LTLFIDVKPFVQMIYILFGLSSTPQVGDISFNVEIMRLILALIDIKLFVQNIG